MRKINRVKLFVNDDSKSQKVAQKIRDELLFNHFKITNNDYDLVISIGGDGCFLRMLKQENFNDQIYYVGVNAGTLGFLQEIDIANTKNFVKRLNTNDYKIEELSVQETIIKTNKKTMYLSLNEIVLRKADFSVFKAPIYIDNEYLEDFSGDGLLISTATGSTAYNMSFGGAIIYNTLKALSITPIAPLNNKAYRTLVNPIIIPHDMEIKIKMSGKDEIFMMIDGTKINHQNVKEIITRVQDKKILCLRMNDFHFVRTVNEKIIGK